MEEGEDKMERYAEDEMQIWEETIGKGDFGEHWEKSVLDEKEWAEVFEEMPRQQAE